METKFKQISTITHQGIAITFARIDQVGSVDIYYNVLNLKIDSQSDNEDWSGFRKLTIPEELRPLGMSLIDIDTETTAIESIADAPFTVVSDQTNVSVFQQSSRGTLLSNRYMLKNKVPENGVGESYLALEPSWEVRFERSSKQDIPSGPKDSQNYQDPTGDPFIEPTLELPMINNLKDGRFDVLLVPNSKTGSYNWQFFAFNDSTKEMDLFSFPMSDNGLFDLTGKTLNSNQEISPDSSFKLKSSGTGNAAIDLDFQYAPSAELYFKQERIQSKTGESQLLERNARVMLCLAVKEVGTEKPTNVATIDFSVAKDGMLSSVQNGTELEKIESANYTLEFYENSYVELPNNNSSLSIDGSFKLSAWIYPDQNMESEQLVLGGDPSAADKDQAPYIKLIKGAKIKAGFGNGTDPSWCETQAVIAPEKWFQIMVSYDSTSGTYKMNINGENVPLTTSSAKGSPTGANISQISSSQRGFTGKMDLVSIYKISGDIDTLVGQWKFDSVDYNSNPPTTPDTTDNANNGMLLGPKLVPSNSPTESNTSGVMTLDENGLSTYTGILDFIELESSPFLSYGSDGYLHLYFQAMTDMFSVATYDVESARAVFTAGWEAKATNIDTQEGYVQLVAAKSGVYMNNAEIKITNAASDGLMDVIIDNKKGGKETWLGVPSRYDQFVKVLNGEFSNDPSDPTITNGSAVYFDVQGKYPSCRLPVNSNASDASLVFIARSETELPLSSVTTSDKSSSKIKVLLDFSPEKWTSDSVVLTQTWKNVPVSAKLFVETLNGINTNFDYSSTSSVNTAVYNILAITAPSNEQNSNPQFITKPGTSDFEITVANASGNNSSLCDVTIDLTNGKDALSATWKNVNRDQVEFAEILNYSEAGKKIYKYAENATGDYEKIGNLILVLTDGLTAEVQNHTPSASDLSDMLAMTSLFQLYNDGLDFTNESVDDHSKIATKILQSAKYVDGSETIILKNGSKMIGAVAGSSPTNGAVALVQPTTSYTGGTANLSIIGLNGGWINESPRFGLEFDGSNYVSFDTSNQNIDKLAIAGDMSTELWVKPNPDGSSNQYQRLLTFNKTGNPTYPNEPFQYGLGIERAFCISFANNTEAKADYNLTSDETTIQCWINPSDLTDGEIMSLGTIGISKTYFSIEISSSYPQLNYGDGADKFKGPNKLIKNVWQCLAATVQTNSVDPNKVDLKLYLNGILQASETVDKVDVGQVGSFNIGSTSTGVAMKANGAALWDKALTEAEVDMAAQLNVLDHLVSNLRIYVPFIEGTGFSISNHAPNGPSFTNQIKNLPNDPWARDGIYYTPYTANRSYAFIANNVFMPASWHHLSTVYRSGYSLQFDGSEFVDCGNNQSLNANDSVSLDCWITPNSTNQVQTIICKGGSYNLQINANNTITFSVTTSEKIFDVTSSQKVQAGQAYYLAASFTTGPKEGTESESAEKQQYETDINLYVNAVKTSSDPESGDDPVSIENTENPLLFALNNTDGNQFIGELSDVRVWNIVLEESQIQSIYKNHKVSNSDGVVSYWRFDEQEGKMAYDVNGINNGKITSNELWQLYPPNSVLTMYVNGDPVEDIQVVDFNNYGGYGDQQFQITSMRNESSQQHGLNGGVDDVRIWDKELTQEQITDNMYRTLSGSDEGLVGYWKIDTGSGNKTEDFSGNQNIGNLLPADAAPVWVTSEAPLNEEAKEVLNVLGGVRTIYEQYMTESPCVTEYADTQIDAYGNIFSVMKRCYSSIRDGVVQLVTGYKVGDLDTTYLGQVQTKPSLIGFIEGAPPVPSENQTMPFWAGDISELFIYTEGTFTKLSEATETVRSYNAGNTSGSGHTVAGQVGLFVSTNAGVSFGFGAETQYQTYSLEGHIGYQGENQSSEGKSQELGFSNGKSTMITNELTPGGEWEPAPYLNPDVGRRFITDNQGYALVKSATADLYIVTLKGRGSLVKYSIVPNPDIPEDVNIIDFPINPKYIKNGTVDGKVGLKNDPDYPEADLVRGSYFKPLESYAIKKEVERQDGQLEAYYKQFNAESYRNKSGGLFGNNKSGVEKFQDEINDYLGYDWEKRVSKRNIVNTHVWTAGGGLHDEVTTTMDTYNESYGAFESSSVSNGVHFDLAAAFIAGIYGEVDALWDTSYEGSSTKSKEESDSFTLEGGVHTDWFLKKPIIKDGELQGYEPNNAPGKVDTYRYNSFFLAPSQSNFDAFNSEVIDGNWLNNSMTANAVALREAVASENGVWRVMYRTTFVSRVPPVFQPVNEESLSPNITPPANLDSNTWLTRIIENQIPEASRLNPTMVQIGQAIDDTLGKDESDTGVLGTILPWWKDFLKEAQDIQNKAYKTLYDLRVDTLDYMTQKYDTQRYNALSATQNVSLVEEENKNSFETTTEQMISQAVGPYGGISVNNSVEYDQGSNGGLIYFYLNCTNVSEGSYVRFFSDSPGPDPLIELGRTEVLKGTSFVAGVDSLVPSNFQSYITYECTLYEPPKQGWNIELSAVYVADPESDEYENALPAKEVFSQGLPDGINQNDKVIIKELGILNPHALSEN